MKSPIIVAEGVYKTYDTGVVKVQALQGVDLTVERGEIVAIMGPSGCGKTTLLNCLSGIDGINAGHIEIDGKQIQALTDNELSDFRAHFMGFVFQTYNLLPVLTALENVELPLLISGCSQKEAKERAVESLETVNLVDWAGHRPGELSGGQQQRVAIARSLAMNPDVMLFDEVTSALDPETVKEVLVTIKELAQEGMTCILVTHEMGFAKELADHIYFTDNGVIVEHGPPATFFTEAIDPRTREFLSQIL